MEPFLVTVRQHVRQCESKARGRVLNAPRDCVKAAAETEEKFIFTYNRRPSWLRWSGLCPRALNGVYMSHRPQPSTLLSSRHLSEFRYEPIVRTPASYPHLKADL